MKRFLLMVTMAYVLTSCAPNNANASDVDTHTNLVLENNILKIKLDRSYYSYIVDKNTGVAYLEHDSYHKYALVPMLNADGTPVTAEQLEIKY